MADGCQPYFGRHHRAKLDPQALSQLVPKYPMSRGMKNRLQRKRFAANQLEAEVT
jgi:hypothetical protein